MDYKLPLCFSLTEETMSRCGIEPGQEKATGREKEVFDYLNKLAKISLLLEDSSLKYMLAGFALGYSMRGYDSLCDFKIEECEFADSILETYLNSSLQAAKESKVAKLLLSSLLDGDKND